MHVRLSGCLQVRVDVAVWGGAKVYVCNVM